jgi:hypothetical protein
MRDSIACSITSLPFPRRRPPVHSSIAFSCSAMSKASSLLWCESMRGRYLDVVKFKCPSLIRPQEKPCRMCARAHSQRATASGTCTSSEHTHGWCGTLVAFRDYTMIWPHEQGLTTGTSTRRPARKLRRVLTISSKANASGWSKL